MGWVVGGATGLAALMVYLATAAPTVTWRNGGTDGPELAAAAYVWGVAHPPGYPLYLTLVRLAQLAPVGDLAYRATLFSALCGAAAAGLTSAVVLALLPGRDGNGGAARWLGAAYAGLSLAFAPLLWSQAVITEVYAPGAALFGAALLAMVLALDRPAARRVAAAVGAAALLISHQPVFGVLLVAGAGLVACGALPGRVVWRWLPLLLLAPLLWLTLAVRAAFEPALNWGDPSSPERWLHHVLAVDYRPYFLARPLVDELPRVPHAVAVLARQGGWPWVALASLGVVWLWYANRALAVTAAAVGVFFGVFAVLYNAHDGEVYLLPVAQLMAVAAGAGVWWVSGLCASQRAAVRAVVPLAAAALLGWQLASTWPVVDASGGDGARRRGEALLRAAPERGVLHLTEEEETFVVWYLQHAEGMRPDVAVVNEHLLAFDWYRDSLHRRYPWLDGGALRRE